MRFTCVITEHAFQRHGHISSYSKIATPKSWEAFVVQHLGGCWHYFVVLTVSPLSHDDSLLCEIAGMESGGAENTSR